MKRINEIVVVEGKTDSQLLKELYDVDTIETHGLGLDDKTLELIKEASKTRGVIVLTDPDYPGELKLLILQECQMFLVVTMIIMHGIW